MFSEIHILALRAFHLFKSVVNLSLPAPLSTNINSATVHRKSKGELQKGGRRRSTRNSGLEKKIAMGLSYDAPTNRKRRYKSPIHLLNLEGSQVHSTGSFFCGLNSSLVNNRQTQYHGQKESTHPQGNTLLPHLPLGLRLFPNQETLGDQWHKARGRCHHKCLSERPT